MRVGDTVGERCLFRFLVPELKKRGYITAYQLSDNKRDSTEPLYSLRRMLVPGTWSTATMRKWMKYYYK